MSKAAVRWIVIGLAAVLALGNLFCTTICAGGGAVTFAGFTFPCGLICVAGALVAPAVLNAVFTSLWTP